MKKNLIPMLALAGLVALGACKKDNDDNASTTADTMTTRGMDTVNVPTAVPTTDTVVQKTTTTNDTLKGKASDTVKKTTTTKKP